MHRRVFVLKRHPEQSERGGQKKERSRPRQIWPRNAAPLPPCQQKEQHWKTTTETLASNASRKQPSANTYHVRFPSLSSDRNQPRESTEKNNIESVFFSSAIHATEATQTGCTANKSAASQHPGIRNFRKTSHSSTTLAA